MAHLHPSPISAPVAAHRVSLRVGDGAAATYALGDVSFAAHSGELVAVTGPAGSGKTSLLHVLAGLEPPTAGDVVLAGIPLAGLDERAATRLRRDEVGLVLPEAPALPTITVRENVALPLLISGQAPDPETVDAMLRRVGLGDRRHVRPGTLTPGERRRAALARALLGRPSVLLVDEPLADLDADEARELMDLLRSAACDDGVAVVVFTRDEALAGAADRSVRIEGGTLAGAAPQRSAPALVAA
jgi:putative ABC transport system ATP-binding protein